MGMTGLRFPFPFWACNEWERISCGTTKNREARAKRFALEACHTFFTTMSHHGNGRGGRKRRGLFWGLTSAYLITSPIASPHPAVSLDVGPEPLDLRTITPDLCLVSLNLSTRGAGVPVKGQAVAIAVQLKFLVAKTLFVSAEIAQRTCLSSRKGAQRKRYSQNQNEGFAHVAGSNGKLLPDFNPAHTGKSCLFLQHLSEDRQR